MPIVITSESLTVNMTQQIEMADVAYEGLPIYQSIKRNLQRWQIALTSTDVTIGGVWCNRVVAKQENSHSTAPADKQINE